MIPNQFRELHIKIGALIGVFGDYEAPSVWSNHKQVQGFLQTYIVVERHHPLDRKWDAGVIMKLPEALSLIDVEGKRNTIDELLLLQRSLDFAWDAGVDVWVFGICSKMPLSEVLSYEKWFPKTILLSYGAILTVEDGSRPPSEYSEFMRKHIIT